MSERLPNYTESAAAARRGMMRVEQYVHDSGLDPLLAELVKMRASQINGCGFCVDMHGADALKAGETVQRLIAVGAWRDTPFFTERERAALALTEAMTRLADSAGVPDDVWDEAAAHFDEDELAVLVTAIAQINTWNRINVTIRRGPGD